MIRPYVAILAVVLTPVFFSACSGPESAPVQAVRSYLEALAAKDLEGMVSVSCAEWEASARMEVESFAAVTPELVNLECETAGMDDQASLVTCTGQLKLDYDGEIQELELSGQVYRAIQEGGEWRMCGYK